MEHKCKTCGEVFTNLADLVAHIIEAEKEAADVRAVL